jgi:type IV secretory pathway VirB2 component (pilin)
MMTAKSKPVERAPQTGLPLVGVYLIAFSAAVALFLILGGLDPAMAQGFGKVQTVLDNIVGALTGAIGKSLAIIAVAMVGLAWIFGQIDMRHAGGVIIGIGIIFGAAEIVALMAG